jgi:hypothetical protein
MWNLVLTSQFTYQVNAGATLWAQSFLLFLYCCSSGRSHLALQHGMGLLPVGRSWPSTDHPADTGADGEAVVMATRRTYSRSAGSEVKSEMHRYKLGTAKSGQGGKGRQRQKSKAGHCHRSLQGSQERGEGPFQKEMSGAHTGQVPRSKRSIRASAVASRDRTSEERPFRATARLLDALGPGLITGASDDDPSGMPPIRRQAHSSGFR